MVHLWGHRRRRRMGAAAEAVWEQVAKAWLKGVCVPASPVLKTKGSLTGTVSLERTQTFREALIIHMCKEYSDKALIRHSKRYCKGDFFFRNVDSGTSIIFSTFYRRCNVVCREYVLVTNPESVSFSIWKFERYFLTFEGIHSWNTSERHSHRHTLTHSPEVPSWDLPPLSTSKPNITIQVIRV